MWTVRVAHISKIVRSVKAFTRELNRQETILDIPLPAPPPPPKIGIALGGGFARGLAHIGVLRVLQEEGIPIDFVAGTSVGSIVGASFCSGISAREMQEIAAIVRFKDFARWSLNKLGFCTSDRMDRFLCKIVKCKTFEELNIPLAVVATDLTTGEGVVFRSGPIVEAVRASCAYPGMFQPVRVNGRLLVDGMLAHAVPTTPLRDMGADRVLAVYLSAHWVNLKGPRHVFDVIGQCFSIAQAKMSGIWKRDADLVIEPNVDGFAYDGFDRATDLIRAGENSIREVVPTIHQWMKVAEIPLGSATRVVSEKSVKPAISAEPSGLSA
ncbi:Patatin [Candidatus Koribacter versatilis Ellin345]|uniref:Patatin n=1 Tax=Koribacter versatilis (strain Ellin345) TaxID=204669 RepID=Q1INT2_KORVE|nr:patatin-like phospholipase family protein [Candidatus Koribacter versatilis]ABF41468.1 Patatin [Candidatus Koribacter versatilis Ellin345]